MGTTTVDEEFEEELDKQLRFRREDIERAESGGKRYWLSFYQESLSPEIESNFLNYISGDTMDFSKTVVVMALVAESEEDAWAYVKERLGSTFEERFINECPEDWNPGSDRFQDNPETVWPGKRLISGEEFKAIVVERLEAKVAEELEEEEFLKHSTIQAIVSRELECWLDDEEIERAAPMVAAAVQRSLSLKGVEV